MADQFTTLSSELQTFIEAQKVFFVATAASDGRVNLSPKGHDSLRITGPADLLWLNLTGSGNETAAHLKEVNRITLMWCAFEGPPRIVRIYGTATAVHPRDTAWNQCMRQLPPPLGARQYFRVSIDMIQTSCGYAVPFYDYREDRNAHQKWSEHKGQSGIEQYWEEKNQSSLDGRPTGIFQG